MRTKNSNADKMNPKVKLSAVSFCPIPFPFPATQSRCSHRNLEVPSPPLSTRLIFWSHVSLCPQKDERKPYIKDNRVIILKEAQIPKCVCLCSIHHKIIKNSASLEK